MSTSYLMFTLGPQIVVERKASVPSRALPGNSWATSGSPNSEADRSTACHTTLSVAISIHRATFSSSVKPMIAV